MWFFPFALPICLYVMFTDMAQMRITNQAVLALAAIFIVVGLIALPFSTYLWRLLALVLVLLIGMLLNAAGVIGAGDAKFAAAAAPYIAIGDLKMLMMLFTLVLLASAITHRGIKHTPLRKLAPHWESWSQETKFPMGIALGPTLAIYLGMGIFLGA